MPECAVKLHKPAAAQLVCLQPVPECHIHMITHACADRRINTVLERFMLPCACCYSTVVFLSAALRKHGATTFLPFLYFVGVKFIFCWMAHGSDSGLCLEQDIGFIQLVSFGRPGLRWGIVPPPSCSNTVRGTFKRRPAVRDPIALFQLPSWEQYL